MSNTANSQVNSQVTDAVTQTSVSVVGESPGQSMGLVYQTMGHSISLNMQNAVTAQNGMQQINAAVIATACREILAGPRKAQSTPPADAKGDKEDNGDKEHKKAIPPSDTLGGSSEESTPGANAPS